MNRLSHQSYGAPNVLYVVNVRHSLDGGSSVGGVVPGIAIGSFVGRCSGEGFPSAAIAIQMNTEMNAILGHDSALKVQTGVRHNLGE